MKKLIFLVSILGIIISGCATLEPKFDDSIHATSGRMFRYHLEDQDFQENVDVNEFLEKKEGCNLDSDCIAGYASCYSNSKFNKKILTLEDDPACKGDKCFYAFGDPLHHGKCKCEDNMCIAYACISATCGWEDLTTLESRTLEEQDVEESTPSDLPSKSPATIPKNIEIEKFKLDFNNQIKVLSSDYGSVRIWNEEIKFDADEICFLGSGKVIIKEKSQEKFSFDSEAMNVDNDFCVKLGKDRIINLRMEGIGGATNVLEYIKS